VYTRYPENGIMISDGSGMHADSMAIKSMTPPYPAADMTDVIHAARISMM
jgi:hypothetical protein